MLLPAVPVAEHVSYAVVVLQGEWVMPEERFNYLMRHHHAAN